MPDLRLDGDAARMRELDDGARAADVLASSSPDASIMTEVNPRAIASSMTGKVTPWSRWSAMGASKRSA